MKKRILSVVLCLFLLLGLTACGEGDTEHKQLGFNPPEASIELADSEEICRNDKYKLEYVQDTISVRLVDLQTGMSWEVCPKSTGEEILDDFGMVLGEHMFVRSAVEVGLMNPTVLGGGNTNAYSDLDIKDNPDSRIVVKKIEKDGATKGVTIEYYFAGQKVMIPVDYVLEDDYISISVDSNKIQEENLRVTYVSIAPFLNSVENDTEDSYLFLPSGSGALMNVNSYNNQGIKYTGFVYGDDLTMEDKYNPVERESLRMPVYGYKSGEKGGFTIIDKGAETVQMNSIVGSVAYRFSTTYPTFLLRGYTYHQARTFKRTYYANVYPERMIKGEFSIRFYPLSGDKANYNEMANIYRDYLIEEKGMEKTGEDKAMNVTLIGGTEITKSFLGVPYKTVYATTTVNQANKIITELDKNIDNFSVKLKGFGDSGVDLGQIGGGYTVNGNIGSDSDVESLASLCSKNKIDLYFDYDLVRFSSSGAGFSHSSDAVMNSGIIRAEQYIADKANRGNNEDQAYRLLRPVSYNDAVQQAIDQNKDWKISGVSLETLTSNCYSDYSNPRDTLDYNSRYGYVDTVIKALKKVGDGKQKLMASDANDYAAIASNLVVDAPVTSDNGYAFYEDVPFYSMVFKGYVPMTSESVNLAIDPQKIILGAVEGGIGLQYTVTNTWDNVLIDAVYPYFFSTNYDNIKGEIDANYKALSGYYDSIKDAQLVSNTIISSGVHCSVFDNGVTVYVNYNNSAATTPAGECAAESYIITGGAA